MTEVVVSRIGDRALDPPVKMDLLVKGSEPSECYCCGDKISPGEQFVLEGRVYEYCVGCVVWEV